MNEGCEMHKAVVLKGVSYQADERVLEYINVVPSYICSTNPVLRTRISWV